MGEYRYELIPGSNPRIWTPVWYDEDEPVETVKKEKPAWYDEPVETVKKEKPAWYDEPVETVKKEKPAWLKGKD